MEENGVGKAVEGGLEEARRARVQGGRQDTPFLHPERL